MMQRRSPPKHRHDGTSPLPLGMDWSPPPRKWNGRKTVWPHNPRTCWSYCVTIPSWVVLPRSRDSDPVVSYRVQVAVQSPEGVKTTCTILRRFNDFLKLFSDLKKTSPKKTLPPSPPKGLIPLKSRALLEERRRYLEEWMTKLLSDIEISRSVFMASFLELEAAARSSFQGTTQHSSEARSCNLDPSSSFQLHPRSSSSVAATSPSITSDYGSDTVYETSEGGTPQEGRDYSSEIGSEDLTLDEDLGSPIEKIVKYGMSNIDEGLFMGQTILEQLEGFPNIRAHSYHQSEGITIEKGMASGSSILASSGSELSSEPGHCNTHGHVHKLSTESAQSNMNSLRSGDMCNSGFPDSSGNSSSSPTGVAEISIRNLELQFSGNERLVLPLGQRHKLNRILGIMQPRLATAKTDMEDLVSRLNQEIAVKDYLASKVKDLEVELSTTKGKSKENLQQAIEMGRERFTQMKWDMEERRHKSFEMELKLKSYQAQKSSTASPAAPTTHKDVLEKELDSAKEQLTNLLRQYQDVEVKAKADIKVLVKEIKSLRSSQIVLKQHLSKSLMEKSKAQELLQREKQLREHAETDRRKLLQECTILHRQLKDCIISFSSKQDCNEITASPFSITDALDLLGTSDDQINLLLEKAQVLVCNHDSSASKAAHVDLGTDETYGTDDELRKILAEIFIDNAKLRKLVNCVISHAIRISTVPSKDADDSAQRLLN